MQQNIVPINRLVIGGGDCSNSNNQTAINHSIVRNDIDRLISSFYMFNFSASVNGNRFPGKTKLSKRCGNLL